MTGETLTLKKAAPFNSLSMMGRPVVRLAATMAALTCIFSGRAVIVVERTADAREVTAMGDERHGVGEADHRARRIEFEACRVRGKRGDKLQREQNGNACAGATGEMR